MRVVIVGPVYPFRGGIAHHTALLAATLGADHEVTLVSFRRQYPGWLYPGKTDRDPSQAPFWPGKAEFLLDPLSPGTWRAALSRIMDLDPHLVILQWWTTFWSPAYAFLSRGLSRRGICCLFLIHNVLPHEERIWDRPLARLALRQGRGFIVHSQGERDRLLGLLPRSVVRVVPHPPYPMPTDQVSDPDSARTALGLPTRVPLLLFFGIIRPYKGLGVLLEALARLKRRGKEIHLVVAGEFWESPRRYRQNISRLQIHQLVHLHEGYVPNERAGLYFSAADALVAPHLSTTQSGAVAWALGSGLPVITTSEQGIPDWALRSGEVRLVPPDSPDELAMAIEYLAEAGFHRYEHGAERARQAWKEVQTALESLVVPQAEMDCLSV